MDALLLTLSCLFVFCAFYGFVKLFLLTRDFSNRRRAFDRRVDGRNAQRRKEQRRSPARSEIYMT